MQRIVQRTVRLVGTSPNIPMCVYRHDNGNIQFITGSRIAQIMQHIAASVYKFDPTKDANALSRWSSHSLRVGACVLLHAMGFTDTQLQFLLRWKSFAFLVYLRNLAILSNKQNEAVADFSTMPNIY